jgi:two-component system, NarL family, invasion response regulator UvrY
MKMNRIILADDHSFIRLGLIQILKDEYPLADITEVGDGESLVKEVTLHDFDLVITDIDMPGRSGLEALQLN